MADDADVRALLEVGSHHGGLGPEDDLTGTEVAGGNHVPKDVWVGI